MMPIALNLNAPSEVKAADDKKKSELERATKELEGVFIRQLLEASGIGKTAGKGGYGPMIVDSLSSAISDAGGLGMAARIRDALDGAEPKALQKNGDRSKEPTGI